MPTTEQIKKQLLELGVLTLVTVIIWIAYGVYTAITHPSQSQVSRQELQGVPQSVDVEQLKALRDRKVIDDATLKQFSESHGTGQPEASPSPSQSFNLEQNISTSTPSASPSARPL